MDHRLPGNSNPDIVLLVILLSIPCGSEESDSIIWFVVAVIIAIGSWIRGLGGGELLIIENTYPTPCRWARLSSKVLRGFVTPPLPGRVFLPTPAVTICSCYRQVFFGPP